MAQEAVQGAVASILVSAVWVSLVEVHLFHCAARMSADFLQCRVATEGSSEIDFHQPLPGAILFLPCPFYAQETQLATTSVLMLRRELSRCFIEYTL